MNISQEGISLIKKFEGCELEAYKCAAGVWTIGYGHTKDVKEGDSILKEDAESMLVHELQKYCNDVDIAVKVDLKQNEFDALVSWTYNLGLTNLNSSTMLRVLNEGKHDEVPAQIKRWNKASGQVKQGLVRRREAEALMFEGKDWSLI
jgi:lysozyme